MIADFHAAGTMPGDKRRRNMSLSVAKSGENSEVIAFLTIKCNTHFFSFFSGTPVLNFLSCLE